jgi:hypothetical protein
MRLEDFSDRLGDRIESIRASLEGNEDVAVVDARDASGRIDALLIATRRGLLVTYPWSPADEISATATSAGWVAWGDVRASTVQTSAPVGTPAPAASGARVSGATSTATMGASEHSCTILLRGVRLTAHGDGDLGRRAVDAFHDEVVRRGTPWHYPS